MEQQKARRAKKAAEASAAEHGHGMMVVEGTGCRELERRSPHAARFIAALIDQLQASEHARPSYIHQARAGPPTGDRFSEGAPGSLTSETGRRASKICGRPMRTGGWAWLTLAMTAGSTARWFDRSDFAGSHSHDTAHSPSPSYTDLPPGMQFEIDHQQQQAHALPQTGLPSVAEQFSGLLPNSNLESSA